MSENKETRIGPATNRMAYTSTNEVKIDSPDIFTVKGKPVSHIVFDLETMGLSADAAIIAIGAVGISELSDGTLTKECEFYQNVNLQSCIDKGMSIDGGTVKFWMNQSEDAKNSLDLTGGVLIRDALVRFTAWVKSCSFNPATVKLWSNGPEFDMAVITHACRAQKVYMPWKYNNAESLRTIKYLAEKAGCSHYDPKANESCIYHNALHDARWEADVLIHCMDYLNK